MARAKKPRPNKLTPEVHRKIVAAVKTGTYIETASKFAGIGKQTFYDWMKRGANEPGSIFEDLACDVEQAMAHADVRDLSIITHAALKGIWQAAAWRQERKHPEMWGRRQVIQIGTSDDLLKTTEIDLTQYTDNELDDLERLLKKGKTVARPEPAKEEEDA